MTIEQITMPQLGESVTEGTIERWLVQPGDKIKKYDALAEVMTDKVAAEIPSTLEGKIKEILIEAGEKVAVGTVICLMEVESKETTAKEIDVSSTLQNLAPTKNQHTNASTMERKIDQSQRFSPAVLALANEHHINLGDIKGTGLGGRITRKDVERLIESGHANRSEQKVLDRSNQPSNVVSSEKEENMNNKTRDTHIQVTPIRKAIAKNMVKAKTEIPHAWMMVEVDVTDLVAYRNELKTKFLEQEGIPLTYFAFFIKAVAQALKQFPMMNAMWAGDQIIQKREINISIAVATDDALYVPVIKHADEKSIKGIAREIHELARLVRNNELKMEHLKGGTFTVNNTGSFGSIQSAGIINYPQAAILQVESIVKRPVILQDNLFAARDMVNLCLSMDHRVLDGLICGKFLNHVKYLLENVKNDKMSVY